MTSFTINSNSNTAQTLTDGDYGFVGNTGTLVVEGDAIAATGSVAVAVLGSVTAIAQGQAGEGNVIDHAGLTLDLYVGPDGSLATVGTGSLRDAVRTEIGIVAYAVIDGSISASSDAFLLTNSDGGANCDIVVTGTVAARGNGFQLELGTGFSGLVNNGTITADFYAVWQTGTGTMSLFNTGVIFAKGAAVDSAAGTATLINSGSITGNIQTEDGNDTLENTGTILGDITTGLGNDRLTSSGAITGDIETEAGDDTLVINGDVTGSIDTGNDADTIIIRGTVTGDVDGGSGNDAIGIIGGSVGGVVAGGSGDDTYVVRTAGIEVYETLTGGTDSVRAWVSFALNDEIENLTLLGGGDLVGSGNDLDNVIVGNGGDNRMFGAEGNDTLQGRVGADKLVGGLGDDVLEGQWGDDMLWGNVGNDTLNGGMGDDIIIGGLGADTMTGSWGQDIFTFKRTSDAGATLATADVITDFVHGVDKINLASVVPGVFVFRPNGTFTGTGPSVRTAIIDGDTRVWVDANGDRIPEMLIIVEDRTNLTASDFIL